MNALPKGHSLFYANIHLIKTILIKPALDISCQNAIR
jgi:hypothetical protein